MCVNVLNEEQVKTAQFHACCVCCVIDQRALFSIVHMLYERTLTTETTGECLERRSSLIRLSVIFSQYLE